MLSDIEIDFCSINFFFLKHIAYVIAVEYHFELSKLPLIKPGMKLGLCDFII